MDQIAREIADLRADIKDLTVEVNGLKNSMEDFRQEMMKNQEDFTQEMTKIMENFTLDMKNFTLEMEAMFDRFQRRIIITIISTSSFMLAICWGLTRLCGGN